MRPGLRRRTADLACRLLRAALPHNLRSWGDAVRVEVAEIPDETEALLYALGSVGGLLPRALASHLLSPVEETQSHQQPSSGGVRSMSQSREGLFRPRRFALACAASAVLLGLAYLAGAGAPFHYLAINGMAFLIGFSALAIADHFSAASGKWGPAFLVGAAAVLLATALLGQPVEGASRWVRAGALFVQPTLILLPLMILAYARRSDWVSTAGMMVAAAALAVQPDRAMAGVLAFGLLALAALRPDRTTFTALAAGIAGFAVTLARPDRLPAAPWVDQILYSAFDVHPLAGLAVVGGSVLLVLPAIVGSSRDPANRTVHILLGVIWSAIVLASALGNYPTPLVGYGGSAVIGYLLCLTSLPKLAGKIAVEGTSGKSDATEPRTGDHVGRAAASSA